MKRKILIESLIVLSVILAITLLKLFPSIMIQLVIFIGMITSVLFIFYALYEFITWVFKSDEQLWKEYKTEIEKAEGKWNIPTKEMLRIQQFWFY